MRYETTSQFSCSAACQPTACSASCSLVCDSSYNLFYETWINKSRDWHIDGVANKSSIWFFMSTNLQKIPVKIPWHSDVWFTSYSDLSDASLDILITMDSKQFHVLIYHCFLMKKNTVQAANEQEKSALLPRQCAMSQVARYHGEIEWIELRIASTTTIFTGSGPQQLLPVCRPQKNAPRKEILLQRGSHHRNERLFRGLR